MAIQFPAPTRDPVCEAIETLLCRFERQGMGRLEKDVVGNRVRLSFGDIQVESVTVEVALVRLAMTMMDDVRYRISVLDALRTPLAQCT